MESYSFKFDRLCFALRRDDPAYNYVRSKEKPPLLHFYELVEERTFLQAAKNERPRKKLLGPFVAEQVDRSDDPERGWPIVYEVTDSKFDKTRPRRLFYWALTPSNWNDFLSEGFDREVGRSGEIVYGKYKSGMVLNAPPDDSSKGYFEYATFIYPEIGKGSYLGSSGGGCWGVNLCSRIVFL